jgi:hypothetical protein
MMIKGAAAFLLTLVFQLAQLPIAAASSTSFHEIAAASCECCAGPDSCPCATNNDQESERPQPPVLPQTIKLPAARLCETRVSLEDAPVPQKDCRVHFSPVSESFTGYAGVSLAVAFCSFLM